MPSVTIQGAGSVYPTLTAGTNSVIARQASAIISAAIGNAQGTTVTGGYRAPNPTTSPLLVVNASNATNMDVPAGYNYVVVGDTPAPVTLSGAGAVSQAVIMGSGNIQLNTGGGSGTVVGGDGNKGIDLGAAGSFAVYTGAGHDTINLAGSVAGSRSTVEAGAGSNVFDTSGNLTQAGNTILLGAGSTQIRSTGSDSITASATASAASGAATIQVIGLVQDTVVGGTGALTLINGTASSRVNFSNQTSAPISSGSTTVLGGAGGGDYRGGSDGNNLLVGSLGAVSLRGGGTGDVLIAMGNTGMQVLAAGSGNETLLGSLSTTGNLFVAGDGSNVIVGGSGADTFAAGTGSATITSGGGPDVFLLNGLASAGAHLTVTDFSPGSDYVRLMNYGSRDTAATLAASAHAGAGGQQITFSDGTTITFQGISSVSTTFFS